MVINYIPKITDLRLWVLVHRTRHMMSLCEDSVFAEYGITNEQFMLLGAIETNGGSLRINDLAHILERKQNSISMLVDRMVKAGLVKKTRNEKMDRRVVNVVLTDRGEEAIEKAIPEQWKLTKKIFSHLSERDKRVVANVLETVKCECLGHLNPEIDLKEIIKDSVTKQPQLPHLYEKVLRRLIASNSNSKRKRGNNLTIVQSG